MKELLASLLYSILSLFPMTTDLESVRAEMARVEGEIAELKAEIDDVKNGRGIWSEMSPENRFSYLDTLQKRCVSLDARFPGLQDEKNILLKQLASAGRRCE